MVLLRLLFTGFDGRLALFTLQPIDLIPEFLDFFSEGIVLAFELFNQVKQQAYRLPSAAKIVNLIGIKAS